MTKTLAMQSPTIPTLQHDPSTLLLRTGMGWADVGHDRTAMWTAALRPLAASTLSPFKLS